MPDKPTDPSPEPRPEGKDPFASLGASDIDELLAEAQSLASVVAHEVGAVKPTAVNPVPATASPEPPPPAETFEADPETTEAIAAQIESLVAGRIEPAKPDATRSPVASAAAPPPAPHAIADAATDEDPTDFFEAADLAASSSTVGVGPPPSQDSPRTTAPSGATTAGAEPPGTSADDEAILSAEMASAAPDARTAPPNPHTADLADRVAEDEPRGRLRSMVRGVTRSLKAAPHQVMRAPVRLFVGLLGLIDLPFGWMSITWKNKLGYVGAVTAIMAAIAWALVLFGHNR